jgi:hypothetical protein
LEKEMVIEDFATHANIGEFARKTARIVEWENEGKFGTMQACEEIKKAYLALKQANAEIKGLTNG